MGRTTHGQRKTRLYRIWCGLLTRVRTPSQTYYRYYGGRGITVCTEWLKFEPFMIWALENGYRDDLTLDRIETNGNYCPENCRWATRAEQNRNKSNNVWISYEGERISQADLARKLGLTPNAISYRLKVGKLQLWKEKEVS